ncbi:MAG: GHMP kinase, partial [Oscillospiraceae bacterium]|nr:GHMP kinase [Oscillospiraceae bacterium]
IFFYNIMTETKGIYGGRFSGAGFNGCCVALVNPDYIESITKTVTERYLLEYPKYKEIFSIHFCKTDNGVGR